MDKWKPLYHFMAPKHWMNDPNGPLYHQGVYHLFYQWNPDNDEWGNIHWGHAMSIDLVHWEHRPPALSPLREAGELHCFSGSCVIENGRPALFYTSVGEGDRDCRVGPQQWLAKGTNNLENWTRIKENPILQLSIHGELQVLDWRDPFVWKGENLWYMILGGSVHGKGCVLLYEGQSLEQWKYLGILAQGDDKVWECPNFFPLKWGEEQDRWVLLYSPIGSEDSRVHFRIGTWEPGKAFISQEEGVLDEGGKSGYYAATSFLGPDERRLVHGWISEETRKNHGASLGWNGCLALPREISLNAAGELVQRPVPELEVFRGAYEHWVNMNVKGLHLLATQGRGVELELFLKMPEDTDGRGAIIPPLEIQFFSSPDQTQKTVVQLDAQKHQLRVDRSKSSTLEGIDKSTLNLDLPSGPWNLRIFLDHSTFEIFVNDRYCLSGRVYPDHPDAHRIYLNCAQEGIWQVTELKAWILAEDLEEIRVRQEELLLGIDSEGQNP